MAMQAANDIRRLVLDLALWGKRGHIPSALSLVDILAVLYGEVLAHRPHEPTWEERDRLILSKGHGCLSLYATLAIQGYFDPAIASDIFSFESNFGGHPEWGRVPGVEASTGSLGHGPSLGVGRALAARAGGKNWHTYVVVGDGELAEGSVWEACLGAAHHSLSNFTIIIDENQQQSYGPTKLVCDLGDIGEKFRAFGFQVYEVDGHDHGSLRKALSARNEGPIAVVARTIKGYGITQLEGDPSWHHRSALSEQEIGSLQKSLRMP